MDATKHVSEADDNSACSNQGEVMDRHLVNDADAMETSPSKTLEKDFATRDAMKSRDPPHLNTGETFDEENSMKSGKKQDSETPTQFAEVANVIADRANTALPEVAEVDKDIADRANTALPEVAEGDKDIADRANTVLPEVAEGDKDIADRANTVLPEVAEGDKDIADRANTVLPEVAEGDKDIADRANTEVAEVENGVADRGDTSLPEDEGRREGQSDTLVREELSQKGKIIRTACAQAAYLGVVSRPT